MKNTATNWTTKDFDLLVSQTLKGMAEMCRDCAKYEYRVYRNEGEIVVRLEKVRD